MQIAIESTEFVTDMDGVPVRLWNGTTAEGTPCKVFVHLIVVQTSENIEVFARELSERLPPGIPVPLSQIL